MHELQTGRAPHIEPAKTNTADFILRSQESWRHLRRGIISRPQEISYLPKVLDTSIKYVFSTYIDVTRPSPIVAWSILPDEPLKYEHQWIKRLPEEIPDENKEAYFNGIAQLNEWGTDFAAYYWFSHAPKNSWLQKIGNLYTYITMTIDQKNIYKQTYKLMQNIQSLAEQHGQNFDDAVFKASFQHNFIKINSIISQAGITDSQTLDQLALHIGKNWPKKIIHWWDDDRQKYNELKQLPKRTLLSLLCGGLHSQPGVVELVMAQIVFASASFSSVLLINNVEALTAVTAGAMGGIALSTFWGYILIHETIHDYQMNRMFKGFIPATYSLIRKKLSTFSRVIS